MRVALSTHGCRLNQAETDALEAQLRQAGHEIVATAEEAEWVVINSCTITHQADADARRAVRRAKRANPSARVLVTGCYANADPEGLAALPGVDAVLGNGDKARLEEALRTDPPRPDGAWVSVSSLRRARTMTPLEPARLRRRSRPLLKIQDGCNYRCSFCIVPQVRGPSRSHTLDTVRRQVATLVEQGAAEVVLTGVHLGTWGRDVRPRTRLSELVAALLPELGPARLRLSSLDPHEVDDALVQLMADHPERLCRHLHLPVQSGDPEILRAMRRGHTADEFTRLCTRVLAAVPGVAIGTDVIVGFPGEDEAAFARTFDMLAALPLAYHHVFSYSRRRGTAAAQFDDQVPPATKHDRSQRLRALSEVQARQFAQPFVGSTLDAVIEPQGPEGATAVTDNFLRLAIAAPRRMLGCRTRVRVAADARSATMVE